MKFLEMCAGWGWGAGGERRLELFGCLWPARLLSHAVYYLPEPAFEGMEKRPTSSFKGKKCQARAGMKPVSLQGPFTCRAR